MPIILITGAAGNLGRKLSKHLQSLGWTLKLLDRDTDRDAFIEAADLAEWNDEWALKFHGVDAVIHLAGNPSPRSTWASNQRLNIDLTQNVYEAASRAGVRRFVFASSNWVMAGYRDADGMITTEMDPEPVNAYGASKLFGERLGRSYSERWGMSVVCLRIGFCQRGENNPGSHMEMGLWGQAMWLSDRDFCHGVERAVLAKDIDFLIVNLMSENPGMRWDISKTKACLNYNPKDGAVPILQKHE